MNAALIDELDRLQSRQNAGGGVSCVRTIITFLRRGDIESAKGARQWDADKIDLYPEIRDFLDKNLCDWRGELP